MSTWSWQKWVLPSGWWSLRWMRCLRSLFKPSPIIRLCRAKMVKENCSAFQANILNLIFLIEIISTSLILVSYIDRRFWYKLLKSGIGFYVAFLSGYIRYYIIYLWMVVSKRWKILLNINSYLHNLSYNVTFSKLFWLPFTLYKFYAINFQWYNIKPYIYCIPCTFQT